MGRWQIGESGTAFTVDPQGKGEMAFTVTNASTAADRAVLKVNPLDGAADGWFTVTEPMRPVAAGASAVFPVTVEVPAGVADGTYGVQGVAYSADTDPSETSATSKRVSLTVGAAAAPSGGGLPWWVFAAGGGALLLVVGVIAAVLLGNGGDDGEAAAATETTTTTADPGSDAAGSGAAGGIVVGTIPRPVFGSTTTTTTTPPERVTVTPTVGLPRSVAIEILDGDFEVVVEVDCTRPPLPFPDPFVLAQDPLTGRRPKGSVVTITVLPVQGDSACV
jgi:hypothetical protein